MIKELRDAVIAKLDGPSVTKIHSAYRVPKTFTGFPAAVVLPSDSEADWGDQSMDRHTVPFRIKIFYPMKNQSEQEAAEIALENAVDELMTVFSQRDVLSGDYDNLDWIEPVPSSWGEENSGDAVYRTATVILRCVVHQ